MAMGDTDKKPIVMTMPGLDNLLMMYYVVRDKVIKLWSFHQINPFKPLVFKQMHSNAKFATKVFGKLSKGTIEVTFCDQLILSFKSK